MNENEIFCPNCHHFIGLKTQCETCQWVRPPSESGSIGQLHWEAKIYGDEHLFDSSVFVTHITSCGDLLIVPGEDGKITALEISTGTKKWTRSLHPEGKLRAQAAAVWKDLLIMGGQNLAELPSYDRSLVAWKAGTGEDAWQWPTEADNLSVPLIDQDTVFFTTSEPALVALDLKTCQLLWSCPSLSWSPEPPAVLGDTIVVPSRSPYVAAYRKSDGQQIWTFEADDKDNELLHHRPAVWNDMAFLSGWGKRLYAVDLASGSLRWRFSAKRGITMPPVAAGGKVLVAVKDIRMSDDGVKPSYGLYALDSSTGEEVWKFQTDRHIYTLPVALENEVMFGADDKRFHVLNLDSGDEVWQFAGDEKLRASPYVSGERVFVGQRDSKIFCLQWKENIQIQQDPADLLAEGRQLEAAAAFALAGQYQEAAHLYIEIGESEKAATLLIEAGLLKDAADLYTRMNDLEKALELRHQAGDRVGVAETLKRQGKPCEAGVIYEELGELNLAVQAYIEGGRGGYAAMLLWKKGRLDEAAELFSLVNQDDQAAEVLVEDGRYADAAEIYLRLDKLEVAAGLFVQGGLLDRAAIINEQTGRLKLAAEQYAQVGEVSQALRLYEKLEDWNRVAELAEQSNDLLRAAGALARLGQLEKSAELYQLSGQPELAVDQFEKLGRWEKTAALAGELFMWDRQAFAFSQMGLMTQAGEAYEKAARDLQEKDTSDVAQMADLYERAADCYAEDEDWMRQASCYNKVCQYRKWPNLKTRFELESQFFQGEYSLISLNVQNIGYSPAQNIQVRSISQKFRVDEHESEISVRILGVDQDRRLQLLLQPKPDVLGQVLLRASIIYEDRSGGEHEVTVQQSVKVLGRDEKVALGGITPRDVVSMRESIRDPISDLSINEEVIRITRGLVEYFNDEEMEELCFAYLQIEYENLRGETKSSRARDLVMLMRRHGRMAELKEALQLLRPHVTW